MPLLLPRAKGKAFVTWREPLYPFTELLTATGLHILSHSLGRIMSVVISVLPLFWETEAGDEPSWDNAQWKKKKKKWICLPLWERQHVLDCELPASFLHRLVSHSMGAADCSMATPGPMLLLCQDLTSLDYHHNIHQLSSTQPPLLPLPTPFAQNPPTPPHPPSSHSLPPHPPPVQSLQLDPLRMTPSQSA